MCDQPICPHKVVVDYSNFQNGICRDGDVMLSPVNAQDERLRPATEAAPLLQTMGLNRNSPEFLFNTREGAPQGQSCFRVIDRHRASVLAHRLDDRWYTTRLLGSHVPGFLQSACQDSVGNDERSSAICEGAVRSLEEYSGELPFLLQFKSSSGTAAAFTVLGGVGGAAYLIKNYLSKKKDGSDNDPKDPPTSPRNPEAQEQLQPARPRNGVQEIELEIAAPEVNVQNVAMAVGLGIVLAAAVCCPADGPLGDIAAGGAFAGALARLGIR